MRRGVIEGARYKPKHLGDSERVAPRTPTAGTRASGCTPMDVCERSERALCSLGLEPQPPRKEHSRTCHPLLFSYERLSIAWTTNARPRCRACRALLLPTPMYGCAPWDSTGNASGGADSMYYLEMCY